jgi:hypothetical protein
LELEEVVLEMGQERGMVEQGAIQHLEQPSLWLMEELEEHISQDLDPAGLVERLLSEQPSVYPYLEATGTAALSR